MARIQLSLSFILTIALALVGCTKSDAASPQAMSWPLVQVSQSDPLTALAGFYEPVTVDQATPAVPAYTLPLTLDQIENWPAVQQHFARYPIWQDSRPQSLLQQNGFVVLPLQRFNKVPDFYKFYQQANLPIFITSDCLLHLYHIQFGDTLKTIEEQVLIDDITQITRQLFDRARLIARQTKGELNQAAQLLTGYYAVALNLLDQPVPGLEKSLDDAVKSELALIDAHRGFTASPLFTYREDYSQYVPRGHYTRSDALKRYFKAMMWYGRMTFLIRGTTDAAPGLVSLADARIQTKAATLQAAMLAENALDDNSIQKLWNRVYSVTAFYVGLADDLTPLDYQKILSQVAGSQFQLTHLQNDAMFLQLRKQLALLPDPLIFGGTGDASAPPVTIADEASLMQALEKTKGQRLMGQRFVPDSYMLSRLVYPTVQQYTGSDQPFTMLGDMRVFPRGLDVMAVLGSARAQHWLNTLGDADYKNYQPTLQALQQQYGQLPEETWHQNMYWAWLDVLKTLQQPVPKNTPTFMQTPAWQDKQLSAALASWAQLRHDTILYAKQSYTMRATSIGPQPQDVPGYVEPVPDFYAKLLALTTMSREGLDHLGVLPQPHAQKLQRLETLLQRLLTISQKELANQALSPDDSAFIRSFSKELSHVVSDDPDSNKTTIVADVHTDANSSQVLEQGTGFLHPMIVVYVLPDNQLHAAVGAVLSHYEFKHPMSDRLTDEAWFDILRSDKRPDLPPWTQTFTVTEKNNP